MKDNKLVIWFRKYWKPEIISTVLALLFPVVIARLTNNHVGLMTLGAVFGDNLGYYGYFYFHSYRKYKPLKRIKFLLQEFGLAEIVDTFVTRPSLMYVAINYFSGGIALVVAKIIADIIFYRIAIPCYEKFVKNQL